jgi:1-deoxy-D-xylulose-5-phosphate reductoisomerase
MVSAGHLFNTAARAGNAPVLPLDSEHAALWQCLEGRDRAAVENVWITASGGPFRTWPKEQMSAATPADAVKHPKWSMGAKISVDSATLANKALEVIEAHMLFGIPVEKIGILVHPQSAVHGIVEFADGSHIAHLGICDMRQPAAYMLHYPERRANSLPRFDLLQLGRLDFEAPDTERFPLLALGLDAARRGGGYPALFNAANETAVELFLEGKIAFPRIAEAVAAAMREGLMLVAQEPATLADITNIHTEAARLVRAFASPEK